MRLALDCFVLFEVVGLPFRLLTFDQTSVCAGGKDIVFESWQVCTQIGVLLISGSFLLTFNSIQLLSDPFHSVVDSLNCNSLLGSTEQMTFAALRAQFTKPDRFFPGEKIPGFDEKCELSAPNVIRRFKAAKDAVLVTTTSTHPTSHEAMHKADSEEKDDGVAIPMEPPEQV